MKTNLELARDAGVCDIHQARAVGMPEAFCDPDENWVICQWPDGTWCNTEDLKHYTYMSDDYELHKVISYAEDYTPIKTERITR